MWKNAKKLLRLRIPTEFKWVQKCQKYSTDFIKIRVNLEELKEIQENSIKFTWNQDNLKVIQVNQQKFQNPTKFYLIRIIESK